MRISVGYVRFFGDIYANFYALCAFYIQSHYKHNKFLFAFIWKVLYDIKYIKFIGIRGIGRRDLYDIFKRKNETILSKI